MTRARLRRERRTLVTALLVLCACLVAGYFVFFVSPLRRALPSSASDVHEYSWTQPGPLSQDFSYLLKARLAKDELAPYAERAGLVPYERGLEIHHGIDGAWDTAWGQPWWDPPPELDGSYVDFWQGGWTVVRWKDGWL